MSFATAGPENVQSAKSRVLFDKSSGAIVHRHSVITVDGGVEPTDEDVDSRSMQVAGELGIDADKTELLRIDEEDLEPGAQYRVDLESRKLVRTGTNQRPGVQAKR